MSCTLQCIQFILCHVIKQLTYTRPITVPTTTPSVLSVSRFNGIATFGNKWPSCCWKGADRTALSRTAVQQCYQWLFQTPLATQYDWLLASYCRPSVRLWRCVRGVQGRCRPLGVESCPVVFLGRHFLFTSSDTVNCCIMYCSAATHSEKAIQ